MTKLNKIVYLSDKIANNRKDTPTKILRKMSYNNLDLAFADALTKSIKHLQDKNIPPSIITLEAFNNYVLKPNDLTPFGTLKKI
jgi:HD superfamily phosphohydrolase YqeK